jgi:transposase
VEFLKKVDSEVRLAVIFKQLKTEQMSKLRKRFTKAERLEIVKLSLEEEVQVTDLAEQYDIHPNTIYKWREKYAAQTGRVNLSPNTADQNEEQREIARLKKQLREAELERDILKKAIGIFSKRDGKSSNS